MEKCPCGSGKEYAKCCEPIIKGQEAAETAEALMRARYTSYVKKEIDFIVKSHCKEGRDNISLEETKRWAEESNWLGLTILNTEKGQKGDVEGKVDFIAEFSQNGMVYDHHELSHFKMQDGSWVYDWGKVSNESKSEASVQKVGRNDPCPCGSGKKYKKCCGK